MSCRNGCICRPRYSELAIGSSIQLQARSQCSTKTPVWKPVEQQMPPWTSPERYKSRRGLSLSNTLRVTKPRHTEGWSEKVLSRKIQLSNHAGYREAISINRGFFRVSRGQEQTPGHFLLTADGFDGKATLHMFEGSNILEGGWVEEGVRGMWVFVSTENNCP